jgi:hypothetical protein
MKKTPKNLLSKKNIEETADTAARWAKESMLDAIKQAVIDSVDESLASSEAPFIEEDKEIKKLDNIVFKKTLKLLGITHLYKGSTLK